MVALSRFTLASSLAGLATAQNLFAITNPSTNLWWVANSANTLAWDCKSNPNPTFTVLISNSNSGVLANPMAIISIQNNVDCSKTITQDQANQAPATGYRILLANTLNITDIYTQSDEFEIKPLGSAYPAQPTPSSPTATGAGATTSGSGTPQQNSTSSAGSSKSFGLGITAAVAGGLAYLM